MERGRYGRLRSVVPPITVPAWSCMMASRTPGDLGVYGFRNRADHSYDNLVVADGSAIHAPRLWDLATRYGKPSIVRRRPRHVPAAAAERRDGQLLPDAVARERLHLPAAARPRGRAGRRRVPVRLHELPHRRQGRPAAAGLRDDRQALPARRAPARDEAVGAVRDGRDRPRPDAPRLLEGPRRAPPPARARTAPTPTRSSTTCGTSTS